jgi:hypothetical protein
MRSERSAKNDAAGEGAKILKRVLGTDQYGGNEDSEQTSRDELSTSKERPNASARQGRYSAPFERACRLSQDLWALQCSEQLQRNY